jgi:ribosome-binding protein aMBF1 (putative translation factor)
MIGFAITRRMYMANAQKAIKAALESRGMSQRDLAAKMKVTEGAVYHWAASDRDLRFSTITKVAKALKMKASVLVAMGEN